jgi:hypothetical protein
MDAVVISAVLIAVPPVIPAVIAAVVIAAAVDRHGVGAIVAVGVKRGDVTVAHRLAARERYGEPRDGRAQENSIANHSQLSLASVIAIVRHPVQWNNRDARHAPP